MDTLVVLGLNLVMQLRHAFALFEMSFNFYRGLNFMVEIRGSKIMSSAVLVNKILFTDIPIYLYIVYGCLCTTMATFVELNSCKTATSLKILTSIKQKKFADIWFKS